MLRGTTTKPTTHDMAKLAQDGPAGASPSDPVGFHAGHADRRRAPLSRRVLELLETTKALDGPQALSFVIGLKGRDIFGQREP